VHTDNCVSAVGGSNVPPLLQVVSGAAAKHRPLNSWFQAHQAKKSEELTTFFAKGIVWGFVHLTFQADQMVVNVVTTPNDGSGTVAVEYTTSFARRTHR
jgi:tartrate-resistant acid phosphatase type 5